MIRSSLPKETSLQTFNCLQHSLIRAVHCALEPGVSKSPSTIPSSPWRCSSRTTNSTRDIRDQTGVFVFGSLSLTDSPHRFNIDCRCRSLHCHRTSHRRLPTDCQGPNIRGCTRAGR